MMGIEVKKYQNNSILTSIEIQPTLINKIKEAQKSDQQIEAEDDDDKRRSRRERFIVILIALT